MPAKVISTVHQLAAACRKCEGIVFAEFFFKIVKYNIDPENDTDKHSNI